MKALLLNGSPRKGNIHTALESLKKGFSNIDGLSVSQIDATKVKVSCCIACEQCGKTKGCVFKDDTNKILDEIIDADILVFATPVYWWGISAQLKVIIDKFYCRQVRGAAAHQLRPLCRKAEPCPEGELRESRSD